MPLPDWFWKDEDPHANVKAQARVFADDWLKSLDLKDAMLKAFVTGQETKKENETDASA
jgi:hypothetical protein